ncbi:MAG: hypothetical protein RLY78_2326 [Pseudomonadota bacterium]
MRPTLHRVRLDAVPARPWRNGGGLTRELLVWPPPASGAATDTASATGTAADARPDPLTIHDSGPDHARWQLRLSVADITRDGPFSSFPGITRHFAVLEGAGVRLHWPDRQTLLTPQDAPLCFDGADAPDAQLPAGPTRDLNLMVRGHAACRGADALARSGLRRAHSGPLPATARWRACYSHGGATLQLGEVPLILAAGELLWSLDDPRPWRLSHPAAATFWLWATPEETDR